ncbi:hypothetical protein ACWGH2_15375 [Streptomyces sp. NPDC054871]
MRVAYVQLGMGDDLLTYTHGMLADSPEGELRYRAEDLTGRRRRCHRLR